MPGSRLGTGVFAGLLFDLLSWWRRVGLVLDFQVAGLRRAGGEGARDVGLLLALFEVKFQFVRGLMVSAFFVKVRKLLVGLFQLRLSRFLGLLYLRAAFLVPVSWRSELKEVDPS